MVHLVHDDLKLRFSDGLAYVLPTVLPCLRGSQYGQTPMLGAALLSSILRMGYYVRVDLKGMETKLVLQG